jgi:hypothetical protein
MRSLARGVVADYGRDLPSPELPVLRKADRGASGKGRADVAYACVVASAASGGTLEQVDAGIGGAGENVAR